MQYCRKCGTAMADDAAFCTNCGQKAGLPTIQGAYLPPAVSSTVSNKHAVWYGLGIAGILIAAGLIAFFSAQNTKALPGPQATKKVVASTPVPPEPSQSTLGLQNPTANADALTEFRVNVQAKERINTEIIDLASQINSRLSQSGTLRYSQDLKDRARIIINDIPQYSRRLSEKNYPSEFQGAKSLLLQLFDLETTRVRSLYNGLTEGLNGQDYQSSFSVGTRAAYKFDDLNARFVQEYSTLDRR